MILNNKLLYYVKKLIKILNQILIVKFKKNIYIYTLINRNN